MQAKPNFQGNSLRQFKEDMQMVASNMISVVTNWYGGDNRQHLSAYIVSQESNGYLIAVRDDENGNPEILEAAKALHEMIQAKHGEQND